MVRRLIATLERFGATSLQVSGNERLFASTRMASAGDDLSAEGDLPSHCRILLAGQAFRHKMLPDGRRQILGFLVPGDIIDLQGLFLGLDHMVTAFTPCELGLVSHTKLTELMRHEPSVARALWRISLVEAAIAREWLVGLGRRTAYARVAHLFCEMRVRLATAGLLRHDGYSFPVTQQHLSDALGLSAVHTNRTLQILRGEGLLAFQAGVLQILDWPGLQAAGEFDPGYLHIPKG